MLLFRGNKVRMFSTIVNTNHSTSVIHHSNSFLQQNFDNLILLNCPIQNNDAFSLFPNLLHNANNIICADGGANRLFEYNSNLIPYSVIGDLDSLQSKVRDYYSSKNVLIKQIEDQNHNDLQKCLEFVCNSAKEKITTVIYGFGGRMDQELCNLSAILEYQKKFPNYSHRFILVSPYNTSMILLPNQSYHLTRITEVEDKICGLIPLEGACTQVTTTGFQWNLQQDTLQFGTFISTSNQWLDKEAVVQLPNHSNHSLFMKGCCYSTLQWKSFALHSWTPQQQQQQEQISSLIKEIGEWKEDDFSKEELQAAHVHMKTNLENLILAIPQQEKQIRSSILKLIGKCYQQAAFGFEKDIELAFKYFLESAILEDAESQFLVGYLYLHGLDMILSNENVDSLENVSVTKEDIKELEDNVYFDEETNAYIFMDDKSLRKKKIDDLKKNNPKQKSQLPGISEQVMKLKLKENSKLAANWLKRAAQKAQPEALVLLAKLYAEGNGVLPNFKFTKYLLEIAASKHNTNALYALGEMYYTGIQLKAPKQDNFEKVYQLEADSVDTKELQAQMLSCSREEEDFVIQRDVIKAMEYFETAANLGDASAQYFVGHAYHQATEMDQNMNKALYYLKRAVAQNHPGANYYVALMYKTGDGVPQNEQLFWEHFNRAVELKWGPALYHVADLHYRGMDGFKKDFEKAFAYYKEAASQGEVDAIFCLGTMYYNGEGTEQNYKKAYNCYQNAASKGLKNAILALATMVFKGEGVAKDEKYAQHLLSVLKTMK